jgi:hypothetical protein
MTGRALTLKRIAWSAPKFEVVEGSEFIDVFDLEEVIELIRNGYEDGIEINFQ